MAGQPTAGPSLRRVPSFLGAIAHIQVQRFSDGAPPVLGSLIEQPAGEFATGEHSERRFQNIKLPQGFLPADQVPIDLRLFRLFRQVPDHVWNEIIRPTIQLRFVRPGDVLVQQNEEATHLLFLLEGTAAVHTQSKAPPPFNAATLPVTDLTREAAGPLSGGGVQIIERLAIDDRAAVIGGTSLARGRRSIAHPGVGVSGDGDAASAGVPLARALSLMRAAAIAKGVADLQAQHRGESSHGSGSAVARLGLGQPQNSYFQSPSNSLSSLPAAATGALLGSSGAMRSPGKLGDGSSGKEGGSVPLSAGAGGGRRESVVISGHDRRRSLAGISLLGKSFKVVLGPDGTEDAATTAKSFKSVLGDPSYAAHRASAFAPRDDGGAGRMAKHRGSLSAFSEEMRVEKIKSRGPIKLSQKWNALKHVTTGSKAATMFNAIASSTLDLGGLEEDTVDDDAEAVSASNGSLHRGMGDADSLDDSPGKSVLSDDSDPSHGGLRRLGSMSGDAGGGAAFETASAKHRRKEEEKAERERIQKEAEALVAAVALMARAGGPSPDLRSCLLNPTAISQRMPQQEERLAALATPTGKHMRSLRDAISAAATLQLGGQSGVIAGEAVFGTDAVRLQKRFDCSLVALEACVVAVVPAEAAGQASRVVAPFPALTPHIRAAMAPPPANRRDQDTALTARIIEEHPFFAGLPPPELRRLAAAVTYTCLPPFTTIVQQGVAPKEPCFYIVLSGTVSLHAHPPGYRRPTPVLAADVAAAAAAAAAASRLPKRGSTARSLRTGPSALPRVKSGPAPPEDIIELHGAVTTVLCSGDGFEEWVLAPPPSGYEPSPGSFRGSAAAAAALAAGIAAGVAKKRKAPAATAITREVTELLALSGADFRAMMAGREPLQHMESGGGLGRLLVILSKDTELRSELDVQFLVHRTEHVQPFRDLEALYPGAHAGVCRGGRLIEVDAGEPLIKQGESSENMCVVVDGLVGVHRLDDESTLDGPAHAATWAGPCYSAMGPGEWFGEGALNNIATVAPEAPASFIALAPTKLLWFQRLAVLDVLQGLHHKQHRVRVETLRSVPLLAALPEPVLALLAKHLERRTLPRGATVLTQGNPATDLFLIHTGELVRLMREAAPEKPAKGRGGTSGAAAGKSFLTLLDGPVVARVKPPPPPPATRERAIREQVQLGKASRELEATLPWAAAREVFSATDAIAGAAQAMLRCAVPRVGAAAASSAAAAAVPLRSMALVGPGAFLGLHAALLSVPELATVVCRTSVVAYVMPADELAKRIPPHLAAGIRAALAADRTAALGGAVKVALPAATAGALPSPPPTASAAAAALLAATAAREADLAGLAGSVGVVPPSQLAAAAFERAKLRRKIPAPSYTADEEATRVDLREWAELMHAKLAATAAGHHHHHHHLPGRPMSPDGTRSHSPTMGGQPTGWPQQQHAGSSPGRLYPPSRLVAPKSFSLSHGTPAYAARALSGVISSLKTAAAAAATHHPYSTAPAAPAWSWATEGLPSHVQPRLADSEGATGLYRGPYPRRTMSPVHPGSAGVRLHAMGSLHALQSALTGARGRAASAGVKTARSAEASGIVRARPGTTRGRTQIS